MDTPTLEYSVFRVMKV